MDWLLVFTGESCLGEHAIKDQQFITLSLSTNPPVFLLACLSCSHADRNMHRQASLVPCNTISWDPTLQRQQRQEPRFLSPVASDFMSDVLFLGDKLR